MVSDTRREAIGRDVNAVKDDLRKLKTDAGTFAKDAYDAGCCSASDATKSLRVRGKLGLRMAREQLETRPATIAVAAFGVGLVMGLFLLRRRA
jgi:hypothetical protein